MIRKTALLSCPPERAFELFTKQASEWWPEARRHTKDPRSEIRLQPSGRFWEQAADGHAVELGRVRAWEPPHRLVLDFYPGTDPDHPTEVVITFAAEGHGTRVIVDHGPTPESADLWSLRVARFDQSWDAVLEGLARASGGEA